MIERKHEGLSAKDSAQFEIYVLSRKHQADAEV